MNANIKSIIQKQREFFKTGRSKKIDFRRTMLKKLKLAIEQNESAIMEALKRDLNKSPVDAYTSEIGLCLVEIKNLLKNIDKWTKPVRVKSPLSVKPAKSMVYPEPYGVVLVMGAWNYPFELSLMPAIGAIAAGNTVMIKTPPFAANTGAVIKKIADETFPDNYFAVFSGDVEESKLLIQERFDYIFYTGGKEAAKIIMKEAANHLTPVTLELGGKSPAIVASDADLEITARRIAWGKFLNCGQTCIAPDYVLAQRDVKQKLIENLIRCIKDFYPGDPKNSPDYNRIINDQHFQRLSALMKCGKIVYGGDTDRNTRYVAPTLLDGVTLDDEVMKEEIFGPILPVLEFGELEEAYKIIEAQARPLALYLFTKSRLITEEVLNRLSFGGGCINATIMHVVNHELPFGGIGASGMGSYHGRYSLETFSHKKSILKKPFWMDMKKKYPPYDAKSLPIVKKIFY